MKGSAEASVATVNDFLAREDHDIDEDRLVNNHIFAQAEAQTAQYPPPSLSCYDAVRRNFISQAGFFS